MAVYEVEIQKINREVVDVAQIREGVKNRIPKKFNFLKLLPKFTVNIKEGEPVYIIWNEGKPKISPEGKGVCIAYLYKDGKVIRGWSI